ncbi:MAG: RNA 2',3'-cyclic phosphodiesterase [Fimbriimonadaceae bacterium]|nr:RNA 2',3'-cyclic phosphodiesterase [Fimbriimonadaceae bacterium]
MRAFLAVVPPREARDRIEAVRDPLKELAPDGRWVHPSLWHVTLKFLGDVEDELIPAVAAIVSEVAGRYDAFDVSVSGMGMFPNHDRPRVLWAGLTEGADLLAELSRAIDEGLDGLGFEPDEQGFEPHMTLARFRDPYEAGGLAGALDRESEIARFEVDAVVLMKSVLRPRGPDYTVIERLALIPRPQPEAEAEGEDAASTPEEATAESTAPVDPVAEPAPEATAAEPAAEATE